MYFLRFLLVLTLGHVKNGVIESFTKKFNERPIIRNVYTFDPPGLEAKWEKVDALSLKDPVIGYTFRMIEAEFVAIPANDEYQEVNLEGRDANTVTVGSLKYDTWYEITVRARTKKQKGPWSYPAMVRILKSDGDNKPGPRNMVN